MVFFPQHFSPPTWLRLGSQGPGAGDRQARSSATAHFGAANGLGNPGSSTRGIAGVAILLGETIDQMILNQKLSHNFLENT